MDRSSKFRREGTVFRFTVIGVVFPDSDFLNDGVTQSEEGGFDGVEGMDFSSYCDETLHDRGQGGDDDVAGTRSAGSGLVVESAGVGFGAWLISRSSTCMTSTSSTQPSIKPGVRPRRSVCVGCRGEGRVLWLHATS